MSFPQTTPGKACLQLSQMWHQFVKTEENKEKEGYRNNRGYETRPMGCCGQVESGRIGIRTLAVWMGPRHTLWFGHFMFSHQRLGPENNLKTWTSQGASHACKVKFHWQWVSGFSVHRSLLCYRGIDRANWKFSPVFFVGLELRMNSEVPELPPGQEQEPWRGCVGKWSQGRGTQSRAALMWAALHPLKSVEKSLVLSLPTTCYFLHLYHPWGTL